MWRRWRSGGWKRSSLKSATFAEAEFEIEGALGGEEKDELLDTLQRNKEVFQKKGFGEADVPSFRINTQEECPIMQRDRRWSPPDREMVEREVSNMLEKGMIARFESPWHSCVVFVKKKSGE